MFFPSHKGLFATGIYYYCNHSGYFSPRGEQCRSLKSQGTSKIDTYCTAGIVLVVGGNGCVGASVCATHYGHQLSLGHTRLSKETQYHCFKNISGHKLPLPQLSVVAQENCVCLMGLEMGSLHAIVSHMKLCLHYFAFITSFKFLLCIFSFAIV